MDSKIFYILALLLQFTVCYEIEQDKSEVLDEFIASSDENQESLPINKISNTDDHEEVIETDNLDEDSNEEVPENVVSFAGPVKAKGSVAMAANFGYSAPGSFSYPTFSASPLFPQFRSNFYYSPPLAYPMFYTFPYIHAESFSRPEIKDLSNLQNDYEESQSIEPGKESKNDSKTTQCKLNATLENELEKSQCKIVRGKKDFLLEITPMKQVIKAVSEGNNEMAKSAQMVAPEEKLTNTVAFLDKDFTNYDKNEALDDNTTDVNVIEDEIEVVNNTKEKENEDRVVFGGFVPASGTVSIAAKF